MTRLKIQVKELFKKYKDLQVISNLNMDFSSDRIHCIFGPSGCGKTIFVNILTGLVDADEGWVEGLEGKSFSYIFQEDRLIPWATVEENMLFVLESHYSKSEARQLAGEYLSLVNLLKFKNSYPEQLSGGMKQRAAIARAFAYGGDIVVMDEPFKGLDLELKKGLMDYIINDWNHKNRFFFFITHDVDEALYIADDIHVFQGLPLTLKKQITIEIPSCDRGKYRNEMGRYKDLLLGDF